MRIHGLLNWYDEPLRNLANCLAGFKLAGVDHVIAVDGSYVLYPDGLAESHPNQHAAIALCCRQLEMALTLHVPTERWAGNEVQKRTFLFGLAWQCADPGDWFLVLDADAEIVTVPDDLRTRLEQTELEVAEVDVLDTVAQKANQDDWPPHFTARCFFKAQSIHLETNHINYVTADGRYLWGDGSHAEELLPALDCTDALIEHRPDQRPTERQMAKLGYYSQRDEERIERGHCQRCNEPAARLVAVNWRKNKIGPVADWMEACATCAEELDKIGRRQLRKLGINPDRVRIENRNGQPPGDSLSSQKRKFTTQRG